MITFMLATIRLDLLVWLLRRERHLMIAFFAVMIRLNRMWLGLLLNLVLLGWLVLLRRLLLRAFCVGLFLRLDDDLGTFRRLVA